MRTADPPEGGPLDARLTVVVGSGGVGKTTIAAALGLQHAREGRDSLVMTFDPSLRLKDALGVGEDALDREVRVAVEAPGSLHASLLDPRATFDRLVARYAPDERARDRILSNRFYRHLAGSLGGILEYMAVERLYEAAAARHHARIVLDTPPTRQALDFLEAPARIVGFLDSGALRIALRHWFDERGHLRGASGIPLVGRGIEAFLDRAVGLGLLRDMAEFFQAFGPLFDGFRQRALEVQALLKSSETRFLVVSGPGEERIADTMFFVRKLHETGHRVGPILVNRIHPLLPPRPREGVEPTGTALLRWLGERDRRGLTTLEGLVGRRGLVGLPLLPGAPAGLEELEQLGLNLVREASSAAPALS